MGREPSRFAGRADSSSLAGMKPVDQGTVSRLLPRLQRLGVSPIGARQTLEGNVISDPRDRQIVGRIVRAALDRRHEEGHSFVVTAIEHW